MSYKLQVTDSKSGINANLRYENISKIEKPEIVAKASDGTVVRERMFFNGQQVIGSTRQYADDNGKIYQKDELTFFYGEQVVEQVSQTKVFEITEYQPVQNYTDKYVIEKFYELFPDDNGMKKDIDRKMAINGNSIQMRKLWTHLMENALVGRGEFNASSRGFVSGDGFIRAVEFAGFWGLEIGICKEEKVFSHLQEHAPTIMPSVDKPKTVKIRMMS